MNITTLPELIAGLGGAEAAALALSAHSRKPIGAKAVYKWMERGALPGKWIGPVREEADKRGLPVTVETLVELAHPGVARSEAA